MKYVKCCASASAVLLMLGTHIAGAQEPEVAIQAEADEAAIEELRRQHVELYNEGDMDGMLELFSEDVLFYDSRGRSHEGKDAVRELYDGLREEGFTEVDLEAVETEVWRDNAYDIGRYTYTNGDVEPMEGYYLVLLSREDGDWRLHRVIANMTMPEADEHSND